MEKKYWKIYWGTYILASLVFIPLSSLFFPVVGWAIVVIDTISILIGAFIAWGAINFAVGLTGIIRRG